MSKVTLETIAEQQERILQMLTDMRTERERTRANYQRQYMRDMRASKALGITTRQYRETRDPKMTEDTVLRIETNANVLAAIKAIRERGERDVNLLALCDAAEREITLK